MLIRRATGEAQHCRLVRPSEFADVDPLLDSFTQLESLLRSLEIENKIKDGAETMLGVS